MEVNGQLHASASLPSVAMDRRLCGLDSEEKNSLPYGTPPSIYINVGKGKFLPALN